jgi:hypothetical protein
MKQAVLPFTLFVVLLCACNRVRSSDDSEVLAGIGERTLKRSYVTALIPKGTSSADSLIIAENITKKWIKDVLVYDVALRNLGEGKEEIDRQVEDYRQSLVRYYYQERLVREKLTPNIRESDKLNYYEEHQASFILNSSLIKGLFLKIPVDAPGLNDVKSWFKQTSEDALEKIAKYSMQNAVFYDYFYDRWVEFEEIMTNIPLHVPNVNVYLKTNKTVEVADSSYCYLLNIKEYIPSGKVAPYDYVNQQIVDMLINREKVKFLKDFEDELYNDALRKGKVNIYYNEP